MRTSEFVNSDIESSDDEVVIKNLDYKPPKDFSLHKAKKNTVSVFDSDETVSHELWLIRVPEGISNDDLASMKLDLPPTSKSHSKSSGAPQEVAVLGTLKKKDSSHTTKYQLQTVTSEAGFAGEMMALQALVPDSSRVGRLVQAPLGIQQHLALVAQPTIPSGVPLADEILSRPIPERAQPEGLKMRFKFAGSDTQVPGAKLSGSGKAFAERWAQTLEKRRLDQEAALLRAQQVEEEEEEEEEGNVMEEDATESNAVLQEEEVAEVQVEEEDVKEDAAVQSKKRKGSDAEMKEEKKSKKEKKIKKEKKEKK